MTTTPQQTSASPWPWVALASALSLAVAILAAFMPETRWEKTAEALGAFGSTTTGAAIYAAFAGIVLAGLRALYLHIPAQYRGGGPSSSVALLLAVCLGAASASGCTAAQLRDVASVAKPFVKWSCELARTLCEKGDGAEACTAFAIGCAAAGPILDAIPVEPAPTSGDEEPHDLDAEE